MIRLPNPLAILRDINSEFNLLNANLVVSAGCQFMFRNSSSTSCLHCRRYHGGLTSTPRGSAKLRTGEYTAEAKAPRKDATATRGRCRTKKLKGRQQCVNL
jgi:hypothetical protein